MSDKHRQQYVATWIPDSCVGQRPIVYPATCPIDSSTVVYSTELSGEQPRYKRMKNDHSVESTREVLSCPNEPVGDDDVMSINPKDEHSKEKETMDLEKLSRRVCDLCSNPCIIGLARKLAEHIFGARELLRSLKEDGNASPDEAFEEFWKNLLGYQLVYEYKRSPLVRSLIDSFVTEERGHTHKDRMDLIKQDPILKTISVDDEEGVMRSVLSISLVYWMDTNLFKIVNLRTLKLEDWPPQLVIKYSTRKKHDLEDLTKELQKECLGGTLDQYYYEIAFHTIRTLQFENEHRLPKNVDGAAGWCVSFNPRTNYVFAMGFKVPKQDA